MDRHGSLERLIAAGAMLIFLSLAYFVLDASHVRGPLIAGWLAAIALALFSLGALIGWLDKQVGKRIFLVAVVIASFTILGGLNIVQQVVPFCGDGVCAQGECRTGCTQDCSAALCEDGACMVAIESCANSKDCACPVALACAPGREGASDRGCAPITCGDGFCDAQLENSVACCDDCGCQQGYACELGACFFQPPRITYTSYIAKQEISATSLAANPSLTNERGEAHPLMAIELHDAISRANNVRVTFTLGDVYQDTIFVGTMTPGVSEPVLWYPRSERRHRDLLLQTTGDTLTNITVVIEYEDTQGVGHSSRWTYPFTLRARTVLDEYGSVIFFITPEDVPTTGTTPAQLWEEIGSLVTLEPDHPGTRFPARTLELGRGSARDIALLLASAFYRAGLRTSIVEAETGTYVRVLDRNGFVILDPARIGNDFSDAATSQPGYAVYEIDATLRARNATMLSLPRS